MNRLGVVFFTVATLGRLSANQAFAVPPGTVSWTAEAVCEYRAIAAQHPDLKLRSRDLLANKFCRRLLRLPREYEAARDVMDNNPEAYAGFFYVNARTHHIDAQLEKAAAEGVAQVVVLGAGFDSRAYRFHSIYPKLEFFEVDLPDTSSAKQQAVTRVFGGLPPFVHYARIDFDTQSLESVLRGVGYDPRQRTLFILEGVSMYVNEAGNSATFEFIRRHSISGSMVVYDYVLRQVVEGDYTGMYAAASQAKGLAAIGEPFVFGWTPEEATEFASRHGLTVIEDLDFQELTRRYLTGSDGKPDGKLPNWQRIIDARVR